MPTDAPSETPERLAPAPAVPTVEERLAKAEETLVEQEHRIIAVFANWARYGLDVKSPFRWAAWRALGHWIFLRNGPAAAIGVVAVLGYVEACRANRLVENQNLIIARQESRVTQSERVIALRSAIDTLREVRAALGRCEDALDESSSLLESYKAVNVGISEEELTDCLFGTQGARGNDTLRTLVQYADGLARQPSMSLEFDREREGIVDLTRSMRTLGQIVHQMLPVELGPPEGESELERLRAGGQLAAQFVHLTRRLTQFRSKCRSLEGQAARIEFALTERLDSEQRDYERDRRSADGR